MATKIEKPKDPFTQVQPIIINLVQLEALRYIQLHEEKHSVIFDRSVYENFQNLSTSVCYRATNLKQPLAFTPLVKQLVNELIKRLLNEEIPAFAKTLEAGQRESLTLAGLPGWAEDMSVTSPLLADIVKICNLTDSSSSDKILLVNSYIASVLTKEGIALSYADKLAAVFDPLVHIFLMTLGEKLSNIILLGRESFKMTPGWLLDWLHERVEPETFVLIDTIYERIIAVDKTKKLNAGKKAKANKVVSKIV